MSSGTSSCSGRDRGCGITILSIARGACYFLYTSKSLRSVGIDGRDGASWIDLQAWTASS